MWEVIILFQVINNCPPMPCGFFHTINTHPGFMRVQRVATFILASLTEWNSKIRYVLPPAKYLQPPLFISPVTSIFRLLEPGKRHNRSRFLESGRLWRHQFFEDFRISGIGKRVRRSAGTRQTQCNRLPRFTTSGDNRIAKTSGNVCKMFTKHLFPKIGGLTS